MNLLNQLLHLDWGDLSAFLGTIAILGGALGWFSHVFLAQKFASHADHLVVIGRVSAMEARMRDVATKEDLKGMEGRLADVALKDDLKAMERRLAPMETGVAVLRAELQAVKDVSQRMEHMLTLMWQSQLDWEAKTRARGDVQ